MKKIGIILLCLLAGAVVRFTIDKYGNNTYNTSTTDASVPTAVGDGSLGDKEITNGSQGER